MRGGAPGVTRKRPRPSGSAYERHEPARPSGADVRAEDKTQPLRKGQQARTDQSDRRHGRRARRLHEERDGWRPRTRDRGVRVAQHRAQRRTRKRLEAPRSSRTCRAGTADATEDRDRRRYEPAYAGASRRRRAARRQFPATRPTGVFRSRWQAPHAQPPIPSSSPRRPSDMRGPVPPPLQRSPRRRQAE